MTDTLDALLRVTAHRHPAHIAVVDDDGQQSYADLASAAGAVADALDRAGVGRGGRVGLLCPKGRVATASLFGALATGAAYVPLDPDGPLLRNASIMADAEASAMLTVGCLADRARELAHESGVRTTIVVADELARAASATSLTRTRGGRPDDLAYVLYTSGSTGCPKGVQITHRAALAFVGWAARVVGLKPDDRVAGVAPLHFDLSTFDLFAATAAGSTMVPIPPDALLVARRVPALIEAHGVTVWYSVPSVWLRVLESGRMRRQSLVSLRAVIFAGEVFPPLQLAEVMRLAPQTARFLNWYGPTETNVCTSYELHEPPAPGDDLPIGRPIEGVHVAVVGDDGLRVSGNEPGELLVAGPTLMAGYRGDAEATSRAMVAALPGSEVGPAYRTGDIVRADESGCLHFIGRRDNQIKSAGHRIELGEVEAAFARTPGVQEVAVVAIPTDDRTALMYAFVVLAQDRSVTDVVKAVRSNLPRYMVPARVVDLAALPRTSTGKVDRVALRSAAAGQA